MVYKYFKEEFLERLFPLHCPLSDQALKGKKAQFSHENQHLLGKIHAPCPRCGLPLAAPSNVACGDCQKRPPAYDRVISAFSYQAPISHMIKALKFQRKLHYASFLARQLQQTIETHYQQQQSRLPQSMLPVPLHPKRLRQRGYNQAYEIAHQLSPMLNIPLDASALMRTKATDEQSGLSAKQRRHNLKQAFTLNKALTAEHVALVDDVMTTGTTAASIAQTLKQAGVKQVDIWVVARTPKFSEH